MRMVLKMMVVLAMSIAVFPAGFAADAKPKPHRVTIQVDQNDPAIMILVLNNITNIMETYNSKGEELQVEVVAYGPGLHMLREDTSPVKDRLKQVMELSFPAQLRFSACNNTKEGMEKREGHPITIVSQASLVRSGAVRLMELQEDGWSYLKP